MKLARKLRTIHLDWRSSIDPIKQMCLRLTGNQIDSILLELLLE